jgi:hypothetical protein
MPILTDKSLKLADKFRNAYFLAFGFHLYKGRFSMGTLASSIKPVIFLQINGGLS